MILRGLCELRGKEAENVFDNIRGIIKLRAGNTVF